MIRRVSLLVLLCGVFAVSCLSSPFRASAAPRAGIAFAIVKNEEHFWKRKLDSRRLYILIDESQFGCESVLELARQLEAEYPMPDDLTVNIYTSPKQYPTDLFSKWHTSTGGASPDADKYPWALLIRRDDKFLLRLMPDPATRTIVTYAFDRTWARLPDDDQDSRSGACLDAPPN
jgi:hypothetical protein